MTEKLYSTAEAAAATGKAVQTIRQLAKSHSIGQRIGRDWVFTQDDIERLKAVPKPGRPAFKKAA